MSLHLRHRKVEEGLKLADIVCSMECNHYSKKNDILYMMLGAGSIKAMIDSWRNNRRLLKEKGSYKNFDNEAYGKARSGRAPVFNESSEEYMMSLKARLKEEQRSSLIRGIIRFTISLVLGIISLYLLGWAILVVFY